MESALYIKTPLEVITRQVDTILFTTTPREIIIRQVDTMLYTITPREIIIQQVDTLLYKQTPREQEILPLGLVPMMLQIQKMITLPSVMMHLEELSMEENLTLQSEITP